MLSVYLSTSERAGEIDTALTKQSTKQGLVREDTFKGILDVK